VTAAGRREVGQWTSPDTAADRLMAPLQPAIDRADGDQKRRLQEVRDGLLGTGRDVIVDLAAAVIARQVGA